MDSTEDFFSGVTEYLELLNVFSTSNELDGLMRADHIGYKCGSTETYERLRRIFESNSRYIYQSIISERRISIIRLSRPLPTNVGEIGYLELSDQKPDGSQKEGFDHVEVYSVALSEDELVERVRSRGVSLFENRRPHHTTYDIALRSDFKLKIETEPLVKKIQREEMG